MATIREITGGSIQGIADQARQEAIWADDSTVATYVQNQPDEILECRARGRHFFPAQRKNKPMHFTDMTRDSRYMIRRVPCKICKMVSRIEEWDVRHKRNPKTGQDEITKCELYRAYTGDYVDGYLGEPGQGRMKPRQIQGMTATIAMAGMDYKALRQEIVDAKVAAANRLTELRERHSVGA